jgi:hypothetical protein
MGHEADHHSVQLVLRKGISGALLPLPPHGIHRQNIIYFFCLSCVWSLSFAISSECECVYGVMEPQCSLFCIILEDACGIL